MKHERHYEIRKLEKPIKGMFDEKVYEYGLQVTRDGITTIDNWYNFENEEEAFIKVNELNYKLYISDFDEEEVKDFYNSINFQPLFDKINTTIGLQLTYTTSLEKNRDGSYRIEIDSNEDISNIFILLKAAWKEFKVGNFSSSICPNNETRNLKFWCTINYNYVHQDGGTNGAHILDAFYTPENGWKFMTEMERRAKYEC